VGGLSKNSLVRGLAAAWSAQQPNALAFFVLCKHRTAQKPSSSGWAAWPQRSLPHIDVHTQPNSPAGLSLVYQKTGLPTRIVPIVAHDIINGYRLAG